MARADASTQWPQQEGPEFLVCDVRILGPPISWNIGLLVRRPPLPSGPARPAKPFRLERPDKEKGGPAVGERGDCERGDCERQRQRQRER